MLPAVWMADPFTMLLFAFHSLYLWRASRKFYRGALVPSALMYSFPYLFWRGESTCVAQKVLFRKLWLPWLNSRAMIIHIINSIISVIRSQDYRQASLENVIFQSNLILFFKEYSYFLNSYFSMNHFNGFFCCIAVPMILHGCATCMCWFSLTVCEWCVVRINTSCVIIEQFRCLFAVFSLYMSCFYSNPAYSRVIGWLLHYLYCIVKGSLTRGRGSCVMAYSTNALGQLHVTDMMWRNMSKHYNNMYLSVVIFFI